MGQLEGKSAVITGAASGIGRSAARLFAEAGARLVLVDRSPAVNDTAEEVRRAGGSAEAMIGDAADAAFIETTVETACNRYGRIDAMFANAGISGGMPTLFDSTAEQWSEILRVNLIGAFLAVQASARRMAEQKSGSIICTASVAGLRSGAGGMPYSASKAGVINLAQTAANQLANTGVRVNAICPGLTETGMTKPTFDRARERGTEYKLGQLNPLKRAAHADELARVALFLASDAASYINGQAIVVDGGLSSSHPVVPGKFV